MRIETKFNEKCVWGVNISKIVQVYDFRINRINLPQDTITKYFDDVKIMIGGFSLERLSVCTPNVLWLGVERQILGVKIR